MSMNTMDIPKDRANQFLIDGVKQGSEFKMLDAEQKKAEKKGGVGGKSPTRKATVPANGQMVQ